MVSIIIDESYSLSIWCKKIVTVLTQQLKNKRIPYETVLNPQETSPDVRYAFLIGANETWVKCTIPLCSERGIHPILLSYRAYFTTSVKPYSQVCTDIVGSMNELVEVLQDTGHSRLALYGINRQSFADINLMDGYLTTVNSQSRDNIIYNEGSFEKCYQDFIASGTEYDGVICANDFLGISLVRRLKENCPERLEKMVVISSTNLQLTRLYSEVLIAVKHNTAEYGKVAVQILETLQKNPSLASITMSLKWDCGPMYDLFGKKQTEASAGTAEYGSRLPKNDVFYSDRELSEMMKVEQILFESDEIDGIIIRSLLEGCSYEDISERHFLAINTVKYHVKKMLELCGFEKKKELVALLQKYIPERQE